MFEEEKEDDLFFFPESPAAYYANKSSPNVHFYLNVQTLLKEVLNVLDFRYGTSIITRKLDRAGSFKIEFYGNGANRVRSGNPSIV